jgi:hypothetical protein
MRGAQQQMRGRRGQGLRLTRRSRGRSGRK